jgi:hypothetical protein
MIVLLTSMSSLALEPDVYTPSLGTSGDYIDNVPSFTNLPSGLRCACGTTTVFSTSQKFKTHTRSQRHIKWLVDVNANRGNMLIENAEQKRLIIEQRLILARLENDLKAKTVTIDCLSHQIALMQNPKPTMNLLDFD